MVAAVVLQALLQFADAGDEDSRQFAGFGWQRFKP
jgi:hypothetical protein